jgi:RHS repeat-associated protein
MQSTPYITPCVGIRSTSDYSPFGVQLDGRTSESEGYRYGFNGMEKDDEVKGEGNSYTTEFRQYDPRLGRWLSLDPRFDLSMSPYNGIDNNPVKYNDPKGLYTERRAERMKSRAERQGWTTTSTYQSGLSKRSFSFNASKEDISQSGMYTATMNSGGMRSLNRNNTFVSYNGLVETEVIAPRGRSSVSFTIGENTISIGGLKYNEAQNIKNSFDEAVGALESYKRDHYEDPFWDDVGYGVTGLVLLTGVGSLGGGVGALGIAGRCIVPFSRLAILKTIGSVVVQASLNKGNVNVIGALADGFLVFGASQIVGAAFSLEINVLEPDGFEFNTIFDGSITTEQFLTSVIVGSVFDGKIELMKASNIDKKVIDNYILFNQSMSKMVEKSATNGN